MDSNIFYLNNHHENIKIEREIYNYIIIIIIIR
jgi:hypothetical protein